MVEDVNEVLPDSCTRKNVNIEQLCRKNTTSLLQASKKI